MSYTRFVAMVLTAGIDMYGLTYANTYAADHIWFRQSRLWMAVIMSAAMALLMFGFMLKMYRNTRANLAIVLVSLVALGGALWLVRSQATVDDVSYMKAMIPHHSIAVLTSERARLRDPRVRKLAEGIITTQLNEIHEMELLIADLQRREQGDTGPPR
jgi:uncharacterized protein (DUF305 family)